MQTKLNKLRTHDAGADDCLSGAPRFRAGLSDRHGKPFRSNFDRLFHQRPSSLDPSVSVISALRT